MEWFIEKIKIFRLYPLFLFITTPKNPSILETCLILSSIYHQPKEALLPSLNPNTLLFLFRFELAQHDV